MPLSNIEVAELLHLAFLGILQFRVNQDNYVLKGGANLRFFYKSPRYSEDIDLDTHAIPVWKLQEKIDQVLSSKALSMTLAIKDLELETVTKPKQTTTTQRWKVSLRARGSSSLTWTRIEFSRRSRDSRDELEQIPPELTERYALRSPTTRHYSPPAAAEQKVTALAERTETQARDVFDLDHLLKQYPRALEHGSISPRSVAAAIGNAQGLPFEAYQNQVTRFLDAAVVEMYDRVEAWQDMQRNVLEKLRILE